MKRAVLAAGLCLAALSLPNAAYAQKRGADKSSGSASASPEAAEIVLSVGETHTVSARDVNGPAGAAQDDQEEDSYK